jgi:hypothetical protein
VTLLAVSPDKSLLDADTGLGACVSRRSAAKGRLAGFRRRRPRPQGGAGQFRRPDRVPAPDRRQEAAGQAPDRNRAGGEGGAGGKALEAFEIVSEGGTVNRVWVEADTKLVRRLSSKTARGEGATLLSDYREVDGVKLPYQGHLPAERQRTAQPDLQQGRGERRGARDAFNKPKAEKPADGG